MAISVSGILPAGGPLAGGQTVTISGGDFVATPTVTFGGDAATSVTWVSATEITCVTPLHIAGAVDVVVTNPDLSFDTLVSGYLYAEAPTVTSAAPDNGALAGGQTVVLTGTGFLTGATATFGGTSATGVVVDSASQITCVTPLGLAGAVDVVVTNTDTQTGTAVAGFTYNPLPTVTVVAPDNGTMAGGTAATVTGTGFLTGATVTFGGTSATGVTVVGPTSITCVTPAHTSGAVDVVVTNTDTQAGTRVSGFLFNPVVTSLSPNDSMPAGGVSTTITGTGFVATPTVTFGATPATSVVRVSSTSLTCVIPAGTGVVSVTVTNPDTGVGVLTSGFTYISVDGAIEPVEIPLQIGEGGAGICRSSPGLGDMLNKIAECIQYIQASATEANFVAFKSAMSELIPPTYTARRRYRTAYPASTASIQVPKRVGEGGVGLSRSQTSANSVGLKDVIDRAAQILTSIKAASQLADYAAFVVAMAAMPDLLKADDSRV